MNTRCEMAGLQRTPPPKLQSQGQSQSEPDINAAIDMSEYVTNRGKRARRENSEEFEPALNKQELTDLLGVWRNDQNTRVTKMLESQTTLIQKLMEDVIEIKAQNADIQKSNTQIRKTNAEIDRSMKHFNEKFEEMKKEVEDLKKERKEQRSYIESLENKIRDLQYKTRSSCVEIRNIPQLENETTGNLSNTICNISQLVGIPISQSEIRDVYRQPGKPSQTSRPVVAEFTTVHTKQNLLMAIRSYNKSKTSKEDKLNTELIGVPGKRQAVYVEERLSVSSKKLFYLARQFAKENQYTFCWTNNGNIFLRKQAGDKQILINSEKCIQDLKESITKLNI